MTKFSSAVPIPLKDQVVDEVIVSIASYQDTIIALTDKNDLFSYLSSAHLWYRLPKINEKTIYVGENYVQ
jgi:hypothetical protein